MIQTSDHLVGIVSWESGAIILAVGVLVTAIYRGQSNLLKSIKKESGTIQKHAETQVFKANGVPVLYLDNLQFPAWYKGVDGRMKYINSAYTSLFGVMPSQYVGKLDRDVWPAEVATEFGNHDNEVIDRRVRIEFHEMVPDNVRPGSPKSRWYVVKFPAIDPVTNEVKGVAGYCVPMELAERAAGKSGVYVHEVEQHQWGDGLQ